MIDKIRDVFWADELQTTIMFKLGGDEYYVPDSMGDRHRRLIAEWEAAGGVIAPYQAPPTPPPAQISRRQFFQQAAVSGYITEAEALDAVRSGAIPPALQAAVTLLPAGDRFAAEMLISGAQSFDLAHPLTTAIGAQLGVDVAAFFTAAAEL
ncbi:MAG: hypothetical protein AB1592_15860 [Pseudomonadota bacterium]